MRHIRANSAWQEAGWATAPPRPRMKDPARPGALSLARQPRPRAIGGWRRWPRSPIRKYPLSKYGLDPSPIGCPNHFGIRRDVARPRKKRKEGYVAHQCRMDPHRIIPDGRVRLVLAPACT